MCCTARVRTHLGEILNSDSARDFLDCVTRLTMYPDHVRVLVPLSHAQNLSSRLDPGVTAAPDSAVPDQLRLTLPVTFGRKDRGATISSVCNPPNTPDETLIRALKRAHAMIRRDSTGLPVLDTSPESPHERRLIRLAFLAPDLQRDILLGQQPRGMTLAKLLEKPFPPLWSDQIARFR